MIETSVDTAAAVQMFTHYFFTESLTPLIFTMLLEALGVVF